MSDNEDHLTLTIRPEDRVITSLTLMAIVVLAGNSCGAEQSVKGRTIG